MHSFIHSFMNHNTGSRGGGCWTKACSIINTVSHRQDVSWFWPDDTPMFTPVADCSTEVTLEMETCLTGSCHTGPTLLSLTEATALPCQPVLYNLPLVLVKESARQRGVHVLNKKLERYASSAE